LTVSINRNHTSLNFDGAACKILGVAGEIREVETLIDAMRHRQSGKAKKEKE
jgi:hypothetical protein